MAYSRDQAVDLWFDFDQRFLFNTTEEVQQLYAGVYGPDNYSLDVMVDRVRDSFHDQTKLGEALAGRRAAILRLTELQLTTLDSHFPDPADLQRAFEDFGMGTLYDDKADATGARRRPQGRLVHMMDGSPDTCVGYHRWHAFIRAAESVGGDGGRLTQLNRFVGLAWAIYSRLDPQLDVADNPPLPGPELVAVRNAWLDLESDGLNQAFLSYEGSFPQDYGSRRAPNSSYVEWKDVQRYLIEVAMGSNPFHGGRGRFWELALVDFLRTSVYGQPIIAPAGPQRGARSALVKALRGTLSGYPRMPLNRPPMDPAKIDRIEQWIDHLPQQLSA